MEEITEAVCRVVSSGRYIGGAECEKFEETLAYVTGTSFCVGVSNGLDALRLIFRAYLELGILRPGDKVIVPANTYIASILAVTDNGLTPVFIEPDPETLNLDWQKVTEAIDANPDIRCVLTVHLYGRVAWDADVTLKLKKQGVIFVEDNAQAIGAQTPEGIITGALGDAAAFSFYPTKNIGALGDAGAVTTQDADLARMVRTLANYGSDRRYHNIAEGLNCRLDPIQAAVLNVKLPHLETENRQRRKIAEAYDKFLRHPAVTLPPLPEFPKTSVWHQYVIQVDRRDDFTAWLDKIGVGWDIHYATPPHRQPCYRRYASLHLPVTDRAADRVVSLPIAPPLTATDASAIACLINQWPE